MNGKLITRPVVLPTSEIIYRCAPQLAFLATHYVYPNKLVELTIAAWGALFNGCDLIDVNNFNELIYELVVCEFTRDGHMLGEDVATQNVLLYSVEVCELFFYHLHSLFLTTSCQLGSDNISLRGWLGSDLIIGVSYYDDGKTTV